MKKYDIVEREYNEKCANEKSSDITYVILDNKILRFLKRKKRMIPRFLNFRIIYDNINYLEYIETFCRHYSESILEIFEKTFF